MSALPCQGTQEMLLAAKRLVRNHKNTSPAGRQWKSQRPRGVVVKHVSLGSRLCHVLALCPPVSLCPRPVTVAKGAAVRIKVTTRAESGRSTRA